MHVRVMFEDGEHDYSNAVVFRETDDTDMSYRYRIKMFMMACAMGLLSDEKS